MRILVCTVILQTLKFWNFPRAFRYGSHEARVMFYLSSCPVSMVLAWNMCSENICGTKPAYLTLLSKYTFVLTAASLVIASLWAPSPGRHCEVHGWPKNRKAYPIQLNWEHFIIHGRLTSRIYLLFFLRPTKVAIKECLKGTNPQGQGEQAGEKEKNGWDMQIIFLVLEYGKWWKRSTCPLLAEETEL